MSLKTFLEEGKFLVYRTDELGEKLGNSLASFDTQQAADESIKTDSVKCIKCGYESSYTYVPYGVTTLADAYAAMEAQKEAKEVKQVASMFEQIVSNILHDSDVKDKKSALSALADELGTVIAEEADDVAKPKSKKSEEVPDEIDERLYVKSVGENRIGAYAVIWGDESRTDLTGEFFTPETEELTSIFDAVGVLPYMYNHTLDDVIKSAVIGVVDTFRKDDVGLWYEVELRKATKYDEMIKKLLDNKKLKTSTQTFPVARRVSKSGLIERWPIVEISATTTPAESRMIPVAALKSAYAEIGSEKFVDIAKQYGGIEEEAEGQGAEKARLLSELESLRLSLMAF